MAIRELSEAEFQATFTPPMRRLDTEESPPVRLDMDEYVTEVIGALALPTSTTDIEIHYVYESLTHVNFSWGVKNVPIHGHRMLDVNKLYSLRPEAIKLQNCAYDFEMIKDEFINERIG